MTSALKKAALASSLVAISAFGVAQAANDATLTDLSTTGINGPLTSGQYEFDNTTVSNNGLPAEINDTWKFTLASNSTVDISVVPSEFSMGSFKIIGTDISGEFEVTPFAMGSLVSLGTLLAATTYTINIAGATAGAMGGGYDGVLQVAAVPLPAAVWLFGSALLGLTVFSRRRNQLANYA